MTGIQVVGVLCPQEQLIQEMVQMLKTQLQVQLLQTQQDIVALMVDLE